MLAVPSAPIDANKFVAYVQERRKKRILFKGEFLVSNFPYFVIVFSIDIHFALPVDS